MGNVLHQCVGELEGLIGPAPQSSTQLEVVLLVGEEGTTYPLVQQALISKWDSNGSNGSVQNRGPNG